MARKHVQKHLTKLKKKHDQVRARLFKLMQKIARHKGSWKPLYAKSKRGGQNIGGSGMPSMSQGQTRYIKRVSTRERTKDRTAKSHRTLKAKIAMAK